MALVGNISKEEQDKIASGLTKQLRTVKSRSGSNIRMLHSNYAADLVKAANFLTPKQLDSYLQRFTKFERPIDMLFRFLLLNYAGRQTEALTVLHKISDLSPEDPGAQRVRAVMPKFLDRFGWHGQSHRFKADAAADPVARVELNYQLYDSLDLLDGSAEDTLASGARRMYATMRMKDPRQFLQSTRIYWAESRNPAVVTNRSSRYRMSVWPPRLTDAPGGLLSMDIKSSGTVLNNLSSLQDSQDELNYWLSAMPAIGHSLQEPACRALAGNVRQQGLSKRLRDEIENAAKKSLLNRTDLQAITAIAAKAPEQLPQSLAGQFAQVILFNQRGESSKTAALSRACNALSLDKFARSLGRWSVIKDLHTKGTSKWLSDYLQSIPQETRPDTLRSLLPHLGINEIRLDGGGDEVVLFNVLLELGMKAEAEAMVDRYLNRLRLKDNRLFTSHSTYSYSTTTTGDEDDLTQVTLQDALAVALARLNRPDDYKRVLTRQALIKTQSQTYQRYGLSTFIRRPRTGSVYSSKRIDQATAIADHTNSLPDPNQVDDINQYIDIHVELNARLRNLGEISRENHVAQTCMLGAWCADRGLQQRATDLLKQADKLSDSMLTGRLWVADLHRLLGQNEQADGIECDLLSHDLLPMSRVPAALKIVAANQGQVQADAIAYRVASYSNHPDVLPLALSHARKQGLKEEAQDIAERLRKVSTLFLPPQKKQPLPAKLTAIPAGLGTTQSKPTLRTPTTTRAE